jgi:REG-2-like HAD superfamily hydrolase
VACRSFPVRIRAKMIRRQQFVSLQRFFPQLAGFSLRRNQTAPLYDTLEAPNRGERQLERLSNNKSVEPTQNQTLDNQLLQPKVKALLVDAAGTLLSPSEPAAEVYLRYGRKYGVNLDPEEVLKRYREAYNTPWGESTLRYVDDGKPFWRRIVTYATKSNNEELFEEIYEYYARGDSWSVSPGAVEALQRIKTNLNIKTAVVSNFDTRLRRIMHELGLNSDVFDAVIVSAEVGVEKPNPVLFEAACDALGVETSDAVHVGDDRRNDLYGARDAGCFAWLWGADVHNFAEVERRLETQNMFGDSVSGI